MREIAYVNGEFGPLEEARVSVNDRGFTFGDGVYEVLRAFAGRPFLATEHWARLGRSLAELRIEGVDLAALARLVDQALALSELPDALVYIQITRGAAPRRHDWDPETVVPTVVITVRRWQRPSAELREHGVSAICVPELRWGRVDIKSLNLLPNVLAKQLAREQGAFEAIFVTADEIVTEGTSSAILAMREGTLLYHPPGPTTLPSITVQLVLELAASAGIPARPATLRRAELLAADEVLLLNTSAEVVGIVQVDGQTIHDGRVGPATSRLIAAYDRAIASLLQAPGRGPT
ncbi:MAG: aminotransferase class IV [Fimbriimonadaceae bacterium]|nr:aminotransferase class IV [Fimbriimonadaceae bacterium]